MSYSPASVPLLSSLSPFDQRKTVPISGTNVNSQVIGTSAAGSVKYFKDNTGGLIRQSDDNGATFSSGKTLPTNTVYSNAIVMVESGSKVFLLTKDTVTNFYGVYSSPIVAQAAAWTWSAQLVTFVASATALATDMDASQWGANDVIVCSEYGDPSGGPSIYLSTDGVNFTTVFGPDATLRHCHSVACDPYNPGHIWAAFGDGVAKTLIRSTNYGQTWTVAVASSAWQGVQISFSPKWVFLAGDSMRGTVIAINRATNTPYMAATNYHQMIAVPSPATVARTVADAVATSASTTLTSATANFTAADVGRYLLSGSGRIAPGTYIAAVTNSTTVTMSVAALNSATISVTISGDMYFANAYYGAVDPATGVYYCVANDTSNSGTTMGMFYLPDVGKRVELLDEGGVGISMNNRVWIANGFIWSGQYKRPTLALATVAA